MKIAIIICIYQRKNGTSKNNLIKMFKMFEEQTFKDFTVFIVGDNYTDNNEFETLCKTYKGKIFYHNSPIDFRTNYFENKRNTWCVGGLNALTEGIKLAINKKFDYYFHLDDDDTWTSKHLQQYITYIQKYPEVGFMICKSTYNKSVLPREHESIRMSKYDNFNVTSQNSVHSSWCMNLNILGKMLVDHCDATLKVVNDIKNKKVKEYLLSPFDASILSIMNTMQKDKKLKAICLPEITCIKMSDINIPE
jgi:hypothetical protein